MNLHVPTATTTCKTFILKTNLLKGLIMTPSKQISSLRPIISKLSRILSNMLKLSNLLYMINHLYITHPIPISQKYHLIDANSNTPSNWTAAARTMDSQAPMTVVPNVQLGEGNASIVLYQTILHLSAIKN